MAAAWKGSVGSLQCEWTCWVLSCCALVISHGFLTWPELGCEHMSAPHQGCLGSAGVGSSVHCGGESRRKQCGVLSILARDLLQARMPSVGGLVCPLEPHRCLSPWGTGQCRCPRR